MAAIETLSSQIPRRARRFLPGLASLVVALCLLRSVAAHATTDTPNEELQALQRAALRHAHLDERSRKSLEARLRLSALLPHLRVNVGRGWQWDYSSTSTYSAPDSYSNDRLSYGVAAQWDLSRLLFQREELILRRDAQRLAGFRTQLLLRVARLYGQRCRAAAERTAATSEDALQRLAARLAALDISLAALTGDEHVGRKLHRCTDTATAAADRELEAIAAEPLSPPSLDAAEPGEADLDAASPRAGDG